MLVYTLWLCLWLVGFSHSFLLRPRRVKVQHSLRSPWSAVQTNNPLFSSSDEEDASVSNIQQKLADYGFKWKQAPITPNMERVPGCVATVHVLASIDENSKVLVQGHSDAIVSRGLLALLSDYLSNNLTLDQVLELDPQTIADDLGVRSALTRGRNDGLANMLRILQHQLQMLINNGEERESIGEMKLEDKQKSGEKGPSVALLLSGGVDSSVALRLLQKEGCAVTAFYLKIWLEDELSHLGECPWEDDVNMCEKVCQQAGVPLRIISLQDEYHQRVMQHTLNEASQGRTPNPDILCNSRVKFGCFLEYLGDDSPYDYIASGHYAQLQRNEDDDIARLFRAPDPIKDQSYFLCALKQSQLQRLLFPIGHLEKSEVRHLANEFELPNRHRPDSQGLCFLGKVKFRDFLEIHLGQDPGEIIDAFTGDVIGNHDGVWYHTVGQRKGIGQSLHPKATARGPWYVVAKDPSKKIVYTSNQYDEDVFAQARSEFHVENIHWITGGKPSAFHESNTCRFSMKIRHGPRLVGGTLELLPEEGNNGGIVKLDDKDGGLAPGQYVVFYTDEAECLGGGIISERHWAKFLLDAKSRVGETATST